MGFTIEEIKETFTSNFNNYLDSFFFLLKNPAWDNPFYIILCIYFITFSLEVILPKKEKYPLIERKGFKLDLIYLFFIDFVVMAIGFYAMVSVVEKLFLDSLHIIGISTPLFNVDTLPVFIQFVIFFILVDFVQFLGHYLLHRIDFLWEFHKIHHAQEHLGFASTRHFHWFEYLVFKPLLYIPFGLLGYGVKYYVAYYLWIGLFFTFLSHCNIKINWGFMNYIVINPDTHFWHHSKNTPGRFGVNFASVLNIWDLLFGTFYLPKDKKPQLGVHDIKEIPLGFFGQMIYPFKSLIRKKTSIIPQGEVEVVNLPKTATQENESSNESSNQKRKKFKKKK